MVWLPVGDKWVNVRIHAIEEKWLRGEKEFYRYIIKYAEVVDEADEEEIAEELKKIVKQLIEEGYSLNEIVERASLAMGIPEYYTKGLIEKLKAELGLLEYNGMIVEPNR
ncbi:hypothetical protein AFULGI_00017080 [Archaeoglobus fulgidus DSM 8774]|jgi:hypothetical protein|uniref:Uncharacterized protein n=1 Tax=Archaeoglobus fulgidus DSM 8774 TaxID=1344584 RepID=A0A075WF93_ARCFL|nr:hypothetical protein [Archaeoglobus fulgidus]AIG98467.1 hypothetical protein AFULGI_00017080 [Archaeoglobus fulgidus DSM 8774]